MQEDWLKRWEEGRIGFHRGSVHPTLVRHWPALGVAPGSKVLVPMCGKSLDMRWLAEKQHPVLGIELSMLALEQFVSEGSGDVARYQHTGFSVMRQGNIELWCGDFFHFHIQQAAEVGAFYDRAALIALPEATRQRYAFHMAQLVPPGTPGLLISLARPEPHGPPFNVTPDEVQRLFAPNFTITHLGDGEVEPNGFQESAWALVRRGPIES